MPKKRQAEAVNCSSACSQCYDIRKPCQLHEQRRVSQKDAVHETCRKWLVLGRVCRLLGYETVTHRGMSVGLAVTSSGDALVALTTITMQPCLHLTRK